MEIKCSEILNLVDGQLLQPGSPGRKISRVVIDSRQVREGDFFVPLAGERDDGHNHLQEAAAKGACGAFVSRENGGLYPLHMTMVKVGDTLEALQAFAANYRRLFNLPVVGVTGSTGKTTTKDLIASLLSSRLETLKTEGNLNNEIGLPLMLLRLERKHQALVLEMGMRGKGEIEFLARLSRPDIGVITNIGESHLELLGSREKIAAAKSELIEQLPPDGTAVVNADELLLKPFLAAAHCKVVTFGFREGASLRCVQEKEIQGGKYICLEQEGYPVLELPQPLPGKHNSYNLMSAVAVAREIGLQEQDLIRGLDKLEMTGMRLEIVRDSRGVSLIDDTYNASPSSVSAALDVLAEVSGSAPRIAVLGDMFELGSYEEEGHRTVGEMAAGAGLKALVLQGENARLIAEGALAAGFTEGKIYICSTHQETAGMLLRLAKTGEWVLLKGSRGMEMDKVLKLFLAGGRDEE